MLGYVFVGIQKIKKLLDNTLFNTINFLLISSAAKRINPK